jgi:hypothetical protein
MTNEVGVYPTCECENLKILKKVKPGYGETEKQRGFCGFEFHNNKILG